MGRQALQAAGEFLCEELGPVEPALKGADGGLVGRGATEAASGGGDAGGLVGGGAEGWGCGGQGGCNGKGWCRAGERSVWKRTTQ